MKGSTHIALVSLSAVLSLPFPFLRANLTRFHTLFNQQTRVVPRHSWLNRSLCLTHTVQNCPNPSSSCFLAPNKINAPSTSAWTSDSVTLKLRALCIKLSTCEHAGIVKKRNSRRSLPGGYILCMITICVSTWSFPLPKSDIRRNTFSHLPLT